MSEEKGVIDVDAVVSGLKAGGVEGRVSRGYLESQVLHLQRENERLRREVSDLKGDAGVD